MHGAVSSKRVVDLMAVPMLRETQLHALTGVAAAQLHMRLAQDRVRTSAVALASSAETAHCDRM